MGAGTMFAGTMTMGLGEGDWEAHPMMFVAGGLVGAGMGAAVRSIGAGALKYRMMKINPEVIRSAIDRDTLTVTPPNAGRGSGPRPSPRPERLPEPVVDPTVRAGIQSGHLPQNGRPPGVTGAPTPPRETLEEVPFAGEGDNDPLTMPGVERPSSLPPMPPDALPPVELMSGRENVTSNFVYETGDHGAQQRLQSGQDAQVRRYTERLASEDRRYWWQRDADQRIEAATAAYHESNLHGVPPDGPRPNPVGLVRAAGVPAHLDDLVLSAYRDAVAEHDVGPRPLRPAGGGGTGRPPSLPQRRAGKQEAVFEAAGHDGSATRTAAL